jgi:hypothetical protein
MAKIKTAVVLEDDQLATLRAYAKDNGHLSTSAALRQVIAEWMRMKVKELPPRDRHLVDTRPTYEPPRVTFEGRRDREDGQVTEFDPELGACVTH